MLIFRGLNKSLIFVGGVGFHHHASTWVPLVGGGFRDPVDLSAFETLGFVVTTLFFFFRLGNVLVGF